MSVLNTYTFILFCLIIKIKMQKLRRLTAIN